jgi:hypothetical protein
MSEVTCSIVDAACMPCTHSQASFCCSVEPPVPRSMVSPPSGAAKKRDLPVHPLPVREQTVPDGDAPGVDRRSRTRAAAVGAALVTRSVWFFTGISREGRIWGPVAPTDRRHGPLVQYSGQLYPVRVVLI